MAATPECLYTYICIHVGVAVAVCTSGKWIPDGQHVLTYIHMLVGTYVENVMFIYMWIFFSQISLSKLPANSLCPV
jgi:hypothetical protein